MSRLRRAAWMSAGWMAFVWTTRIRNAAADTEIADATRIGAYLVSAACLVGAAALVWVGWKGRPLAVARIVVAAHAVVWVVRGVQIALADHDAGFVVVHEVLAAVSLVLAAWVWRAASARPVADHAVVLTS